MTAFSDLKQELQSDKKLAQAWHDNIAVSFYDAIDENDLAHKDAFSVANEAACNFMQRTFEVETEACW